MKILYSIFVVIGVFAGIYQDIIKEFFISNLKTINTKNNTFEIKKSITIPIHVENGWEDSTLLEKKAKFYILRSKSPKEYKIIFSGSARIYVPEKATTINNTWIHMNQYSKLDTNVSLPYNKKLLKYLNEGGYEIQLLLFDQHGYKFIHKSQALFDKETLTNGLSFWFRLLPEQMPQ